MHDIQESKIQRHLHSGRIKEFKVDNTENTKYIVSIIMNMIVISMIIFEAGNGSTAQPKVIVLLLYLRKKVLENWNRMCGRR